jgi:hypothetical protein
VEAFTMTPSRLRLRVWLGFTAALVTASADDAHAAPYVRARVERPARESYTITTGGFRHDGPQQWRLPAEKLEVSGTGWSRWVDAGAFGLHGRLNRAGGVAEWPVMTLTVSGTVAPGGVTLRVQLAERPAEDAVVIDATESSGSATVAFLVVHPLRTRAAEFETGSQMTARHLQWAREAAGGRAPDVGRFHIISSVWGHYDPALATRAAETLGLLGVNVLGGVPIDVLKQFNMRTYAATWHLPVDPDAGREAWESGERKRIDKALASPDGRWRYENMAHHVITDEIQTLNLRRVERSKVDEWFRDYLRGRDETAATLGLPPERATWQGDCLYERSLPREADRTTRSLAYHSGRFAQIWSVRQLRQTTDLLRETFAAAVPPIVMRTETLPASHAFFDAWGAPKVGMGALNLDLFEIGRREAVDVVSAEDWLGLNHMYGPRYTWLGGQGFGYLSALLRSGIGDRRTTLRGLITPSDERYLRLKAYSNIGQGSKSIFYWTFGPTFIGTENYWSDLRSMYDGIARTSRAIEQAEPVLYPARTVSDPVAILYSVSHDLWHTDDPAVFVETRLLWAALRHLSVQPDFLGEDEVEAGMLDRYKVVYLPGNCLTRRAAAALDNWVRAGGVLYLSAGAATRDESFEPQVPPFAAAAYPSDAALALVKDSGHRYNERIDLPGIRPLTTATFAVGDGSVTYDCIGYRMSLRADGDAEVLGTFADGAPSVVRHAHGRGTVLACGFLPGLDYAPFRAGQTTLDERWDGRLRAVFQEPLKTAGIRPVVASSVPVVEANLLTGPSGSAVVLANYTYEPIPELVLRIRGLGHAVAAATSTEGAPVTMRREDDALVLSLPFEWTDIVLLPKP